MSQNVISSEEEVKDFLKELKELLVDPKFSASRDLDVLPKKKMNLQQIHILQQIH